MTALLEAVAPLTSIGINHPRRPNVSRCDGCLDSLPLPFDFIRGFHKQRVALQYQLGVPVMP